MTPKTLAVVATSGFLVLLAVAFLLWPKATAVKLDTGLSLPEASFAQSTSAPLPPPPPSTPSSSPVVAVPTPVAEQFEIELAPGMRAPAFLMPDRQVGLNSIQTRVLGEITDEFFAALKDVPEDQLYEAYEKARATAESEYRKIFGDEAYMRAAADAAAEARGSAAP